MIASMKPQPSILLVDNGTAIAEYLAPYLGWSDFVVTVAANEKATLEQVAVEKLDLLVM